MNSLNSDVGAATEGINRVGILESEVQICANCGKEGSDVTNTCNKCKSVMYCNAACKKKHRKKHKKECERRVAELHDEKLFRKPPPKDDCPICFLRLPYNPQGSVYMNCCGKVLCTGCIHAFQSKITKEEHDVCPFCRTPPPYRGEEAKFVKRYEDRVEMNDAEAISIMGVNYALGRYGVPQNYAKAFKLWHRAGELGHAEAYSSIGFAYDYGRGVDVDMKKAKHYWELAAMGGEGKARCKLGVIELRAGKYDRALKHWMIGAKCGYSDSLKFIKQSYIIGHASKDNYTAALYSYQAYVDEIKSDQRDEAAAFDNDWKYYDSAF